MRLSRSKFQIPLQRCSALPLLFPAETFFNDYRSPDRSLSGLPFTLIAFGRRSFEEKEHREERKEREKVQRPALSCSHSGFQRCDNFCGVPLSEWSFLRAGERFWTRRTRRLIPVFLLWKDYGVLVRMSTCSVARNYKSATRDELRETSDIEFPNFLIVILTTM